MSPRLFARNCEVAVGLPYPARFLGFLMLVGDQYRLALVNASRLALAALLLAAAGCTAPTLAQRQENWRTHVKVQKLTCLTGMRYDPAMPEDVRQFCARVVEP